MTALPAAASLHASGFDVFRVGKIGEPGVVFRDPKNGRFNLMDILAWNPLQSGKDTRGITVETASFARNFRFAREIT